MRKPKSSKAEPAQASAPTSPPAPMRDGALTAREHYRREKARRARGDHPDRELLAAARREYLAMLEADAVKGKGGRPKKKVAQPETNDDDAESDEHEGEPVEGDEPEE